MKYSQLIEKCCQLIETYDEKIMTPDSHAEGYLSALKCEDTERVFLKQIFYGCERYRQFIKASNASIFTHFSSSTNRKNDATLFAVFTYLICFRMDELPFNEFKKMVLSQEASKMNVLFTFLFSLEELRERVFEQWSESLELDYLQSKLLPKLAERKEKCEELIMKIAENATGKKFQTSAGNTQQNIEEAKDKKRSTQIQEFNLTKPKPKLIPELEKIEVGFKANPAPKISRDLKIIEEQKQSRRKQIHENIKKYYEENKKKAQFELQTSKRPTNLPRIKEEVEKNFTKEMKKKVAAKPMPKYAEVDVKLNVAAILREERKLNEKIEQEERKMRDLQMNMRDQSEHETWKKEMRQKDKFQELEAQQRRKIEMELAREAAVKAYQEKIEQKKSLVEDMKQIAGELKGEREQLEQTELQNKKKLVEQVQESKQNIKVEQQKILQQNKKIHDEEKEQRRRVLDKKKQEEKVEMQKKKDLIFQIRQLQKKIRARPKQEIEFVSIGLLEEMTLDQLQQKLRDVRKEQKQEQERRRESNIKKKQQFKDSINGKKNMIMAARQQLAKQKQDERRKKKEEADLEKQRIAETKAKSINEYKKKEEKKAELKKVQKEKLAKQIKQTDQRRMFLMQGQAQQEANAFMNLEKGEEREIQDRQNSKLMEEYRHQSVREGEMRILADKNKREVQTKVQFSKLYNQQQQVNNRIAEELQQEDFAGRAMKYQQTKTYQQKHNENMTKTNPYKAKINQQSLSKAKTNNKI